MSHATRQYYAYLYIDPRSDEIFYVGKGCLAKSGKDRAFRHLDANQHSLVARKSRKMIKEGVRPIIQKIDCSSEQIALDLEMGLIKLIGRKDLGKGTLLNLTDGGESPPKGVHKTLHSEHSKKLISEKKKEWYASGNQHPRGMLGKKLSEETKLKLSKSRVGKKYAKKECPVCSAQIGTNTFKKHINSHSNGALYAK